MSVGIDILKISRLENLASNQKFLSKVFSKKEIEYFKTRNFNKNTVAGAFCAKEALAKAIGCGLSGLPLTEISVVRNNMGKPYFEFSPEAENALKMYKAQKIALTISHDNDMAIAYVCIDADEDYRRFITAAEKSNINEEGIISFETARSILPKRD
ncbi:MAG: holo-ACP synthase, partial [Clostridia bacterium]|nr:holo-ACP synthase [Clostridia bacterium]